MTKSIFTCKSLCGRFFKIRLPISTQVVLIKEMCSALYGVKIVAVVDEERCPVGQSQGFRATLTPSKKKATVKVALKYRDGYDLDFI